MHEIVEELDVLHQISSLKNFLQTTLASKEAKINFLKLEIQEGRYHVDVHQLVTKLFALHQIEESACSMVG